MITTKRELFKKFRQARPDLDYKKVVRYTSDGVAYWVWPDETRHAFCDFAYALRDAGEACAKMISRIHPMSF